MADRLYNAQIDYPFVSHLDPVYTAGILDCLLYMSPEDTFITPASTPAGLGRVGAWLVSREKVGSDWRYIFNAAAPEDPNAYDMDGIYPEQGLIYVKRTFLIADSPDGAIVTARAAEDGRSVLVVNNGQLEGGTGLHNYDTNLVEPSTVVPCTRKVDSIRLYREYRSSDPADRGDLPPDFFVDEIFPGEDLEFNDGYNCSVSYNQTTKTLRFTGGTGFGEGRPEDVPWDDTDENFEEGIRSVNGVNVLGVVPMEAGSGVLIDSSVAGRLTITVRNQGDGGCPPG